MESMRRWEEDWIVNYAVSWVCQKCVASWKCDAVANSPCEHKDASRGDISTELWCTWVTSNYLDSPCISAPAHTHSHMLYCMLTVYEKTCKLTKALLILSASLSLSWWINNNSSLWKWMLTFNPSHEHLFVMNCSQHNKGTVHLACPTSPNPRLLLWLLIPPTRFSIPISLPWVKFIVNKELHRARTKCVLN